MTGTTICVISERDGQVVITFPEPVEWAAFDPETARRIGEAMAREAYKLRFGIRPDDKRSVISEQIRGRIITRVTHVIRSLNDKQALPARIAAEVVDVILSEVT